MRCTAFFNYPQTTKEGEQVWRISSGLSYTPSWHKGCSKDIRRFMDIDESKIPPKEKGKWRKAVAEWDGLRVGPYLYRVEATVKGHEVWVIRASKTNDRRSIDEIIKDTVDGLQ